MLVVKFLLHNRGNQPVFRHEFFQSDEFNQYLQHFADTYPRLTHPLNDPTMDPLKKAWPVMATAMATMQCHIGNISNVITSTKLAVDTHGNQLNSSINELGLLHHNWVNQQDRTFNQWAEYLRSCGEAIANVPHVISPPPGSGIHGSTAAPSSVTNNSPPSPIPTVTTEGPSPSSQAPSPMEEVAADGSQYSGLVNESPNLPSQAGLTVCESMPPKPSQYHKTVRSVLADWHGFGESAYA